MSAVLGCWPVSAGGHVVAGSTQSRCHRCDCAVWIAPSSANLPAAVTLMCVPCVADLDIGPTARPTAEQERELIAERLRIRGRLN